jgi:protein-S-isoprenylcysteine O-methyltransferase Ste14
MKKPFSATLASSVGYLVLALGCLIRWGQPRPLLRLDFFSGTYLALRLLGSFYSVFSSRTVFYSKKIKEQWWALDSDPKGPRLVMVLMALDLVVFLEYGHWRFAPGLARPALQATGLAIYAVINLWQIWTDNYLARFFNGEERPTTPMNQGPYRYIRHPRYTAAIVAKFATALIFASIFGWLLSLVWALLLLNKIAIEEKHLRKLFGRHYETYARTTARVIPGIY